MDDAKTKWVKITHEFMGYFNHDLGLFYTTSNFGRVDSAIQTVDNEAK
jgi:hypothetical protein